jgi:Xaa-Pro dipeptidase
MPRDAPRRAVSLPEYEERLQRARKRMSELGVDLLLVTKPELYNYLAGYDPTSTFYYQALLVPASDEPPLLIVNKAEELLCRETSWVDDIRVIWTFEDHVAKTVEILRERGWARAGLNVGATLDSYYFKARDYLEFVDAMPDARFVDVTRELDELRLPKSPGEVEYLRRAAHVADLGVTAGIHAAREGVTDREVMAAIQHAVAINGGEFPAYPFLVDARGTLHGTPIGRILRPGDTVYLEVSGVVRRYHCNISRTVVIGDPSSEILELYGVVMEAYHRGLELMRPGTRVSDIVQAVGEARDRFEKYTWGRFGFSMEIAYPPIWIGALSLMAGDDHALEPGMVVTLEPGLAYHNGNTMMLGNNILITEHGNETLNNVPTELFVR